MTRHPFSSLRHAFAGLVLAVGGLVLAGGAAAQVAYTYTGNPFTLFSCGPSVDPATGIVTGTRLCATPGPNVNTSYLATDKVTATLSLGAALPPNQAQIDVRTFPGFALSMSDGRHSVTNALAVGMAAEVATDANGNIATWRLIINTGGTDNGGISTQTGADSGTLRCCDPTVDGDLARIASSPGTWTAPPPSPASALTNLINLLNTAELGLTVGQVASLTDALNGALASIEAGQNKTAIRQLKAFIRTVEAAQKKGTMLASTATTLITAANAIIALL